MEQARPGNGFPTAADRRLLTQGESLRRQLHALERDIQDDLRRLLDGEPARQESLQRVLAASESYVRELALPDGQYVVRTPESDLVDTLAEGEHSWPRVIVGEAGTGKSTILWSLERELRRAGFDPVIVSAAWMLSQPQRMDDVVRAITLMAKFCTPILLLDTVDLLLHQEDQRQALLALVEQVWSVRVGAVYSTRPQERPLIHHPELRVTELGLYDDVELQQATAALASRHCPSSRRADIVEGVEHAIARGLPAADVCRSPLLLRMLFEAASPDAPEFEDLDVTSLYGAYWDRRVARDARSDSAVAMRPDQREDLSAMARTMAAALLILGLPQEQEGIVLTAVECLDPRTAPAALTEGVGRLRERGVMEAGGERVGFFHQTMFEYAFARWWLASADPVVLDQLVQRTTAGQGDLFVGAALEQTLILAVRGTIGSERIRAACRQLAATEKGSIQTIGLAAWAHRASALSPAQAVLGQCDEAALARTARLLPSVGGKPVGEIISQLILLWEAKDSPVTRVAVLRALARVARRDPSSVVSALEHLYPTGHIPGIATIASSVSSSGVVNAARSISEEDPDPLAYAFVEVFEHLPVHYSTMIRRLCVSILQRGHTARGVILNYLLAHWQELGSPEFLHEMMRSVQSPEGRTSLLEPFGRLLAEEWIREAGARHRDVDVETLLTDPENLYGASVEVFARGALAARVDDAGLKLLVSSLLSERGVYRAEAKISLAALINDHAPAMAHVAEVVVLALQEMRNGELAPPRRNALNFLAENQVPGAVLRHALGTVRVEEWAKYPELTSLWVRAASAGVASAQSGLKEVTASPIVRDPVVLKALLTAPSAASTPSDVVFEQVLHIALALGDMTTVDRLLADASLTDRRRDLVHELLGERIDPVYLPLLIGRGELFPWHTMLSALETEDDRFRATALGNLWKRREDDATDRERIAYLQTLVTVNPDADVPVDRAAPDVSLDILIASAHSLHYICALRDTAQKSEWPVIRMLTLYPPLQSTAWVLGQAFAATLGWFMTLGAQGDAQMPALLLELLSDIRAAEFVPITPVVWERELISSVNLAVGIGGTDTAVRLCQEAAQTHSPLASVLAKTLAERWFSSVREELIQIGQTTDDVELRELCQHLVREKDRSGGTRAFPELIPALSARLSALVG